MWQQFKTSQESTRELRQKLQEALAQFGPTTQRQALHVLHRVRKLQQETMERFDHLEGQLAILWTVGVTNLLERIAWCEKKLLEKETEEPVVNEEEEEEKIKLNPKTMEDMKRVALREALYQAQGNLSKAARILKVNVKTVHNLRKRFNL